MRRTQTLALVVLLLVAGCSVTVDGPDAPGGPSAARPTSAGSAGTTEIEEDGAMHWDVREPVTTASVGLGDDLGMIAPAGGVDVELVLPTATWSVHVDEATVEPDGGYVGGINLFRTVSGGEAAHEQLTADAGPLGLSQERLDTWFEEELPAALRAERAGGPRDRTGINGSNGDVITSVQISHEPGPGGDEKIRLWYVVSPPLPEG